MSAPAVSSSARAAGARPAPHQVPSLQAPPLRHTNPFRILLQDRLDERAATVPYPPGETSFSLARTKRFNDDPLPLLLECYERYGPIFTIRLLHSNVVVMLGPAANHYITVSHAHNFIWRESYYRDLTILLGDGLLTTDDPYHRRSRTVMLPAFHRERIAASIGVMTSETERALAHWRPGQRIDLYTWTRRLAVRIAMRALFGLDPDGETSRAIDAAALFERALAFYASGYQHRFIRGPRTPWAQLQQATRKLNRMIYGQIAQRRASGERGEDILSLLLDATDEQGEGLTDRQVRDEVMTLLFAGHDTTTSTVAFMFYELALQPQIAQRIAAEQREALRRETAGAAPASAGAVPAPTGGWLDASLLMGGGLPQLEMTLDETLRKYPPAWIGPRKSIEPFEFEGHTVPGNAYVNYSSWASHHLPEMFPEPERFEPERFTPERRAALPKGAYVPFGGGSRTCIGMRFGQLEIRTIASLILSRFRLELDEGFELSIRQMPTISPKEGLPATVREAPPAAA